jgi:hypothetical protein
VCVWGGGGIVVFLGGNKINLLWVWRLDLSLGSKKKKKEREREREKVGAR